ncbi:hypothetical protein [Mycoavidus sp. SF9855]|uniref:hypothetical protein n=1 Tax=Mycoavidus sp. SF9855 TaxID=2968475 RepID=UPI00211C8262|nr:hypothetical protein [Mycoavidus sp. SF9855]UUM22256.1 hypothetical protein NQD60_04115 [Mycoavidus sp. SF9855]
MSAAQYLIEEGRQKGLLEGQQKGLLEGQQKAALEIAKNLLARGVTLDLIKQATKLSDDKIKALTFH